MGGKGRGERCGDLDAVGGGDGGREGHGWCGWCGGWLVVVDGPRAEVESNG